MTDGTAPRVIDVLLVEDSPGDVRLTREAFRSADAGLHLHVAADGVEAMAFLRHQEPYADAPMPDLILLDLNLPRKDGREVLAEIKGDAQLRHIPTVVLTTSASEVDVAMSYRLHANAYLVKPVRLEEFENLIQSVTDFWLAAARLQRPSELSRSGRSS